MVLEDVWTAFTTFILEPMLGHFQASMQRFACCRLRMIAGAWGNTLGRVNSQGFQAWVQIAHTLAKTHKTTLVDLHCWTVSELHVLCGQPPHIETALGYAVLTLDTAADLSKTSIPTLVSLLRFGMG